MTTILLDVSPILYSNLISATNALKKSGEKLVDGKIPYNYSSVVIFKVFEELAMYQKQFQAQEVIYAFDNSKGGYWRKDIYDRYKYKRSEDRKESIIDWDSAFETFDEIKDILKRASSGKVIDIPRLEADGVGFVMSEYFADNRPDDNLILVSLDGDWEHNLKHHNVRLFKTRKTQKKDGIFVVLTAEELEEKRVIHCVNGDDGDGFKHIKCFTKFSNDFIEAYPKFKDREKDVYDKHHQIEKMFKEKTDKEAYKHPRFGYKSMLKAKKTVEDVLKENKLHRLNYNRNKMLALPEGIPTDYKKLIIQQYHDASTDKDMGLLQGFFMKKNLFELMGTVGLL